MAATSSTTSSTSSLALAGLASGVDWTTLVTQLAQAERAPQTRLQQQQATIQQQNSALGSLQSQLTTLQTSVTALTPTLFGSRTATASDSTVASATSDTGAPLGTYSFAIQSLATTASQLGTPQTATALSATNDVSGLVLSNAAFNNPVTAGTITVNGQQVTVATTDTLQDVFNNIFNATGGTVTGSYDPSTDKITLASSGEIVLGSAADTSNFLTDARLENNGTGTITSDSGLGSVQLTGDLGSSNLSTPITDGGGGAGEFRINGVSISYNASTDSINDVLTRINNSAAGVSASYDAVNDRFELTNKTTGDVGIGLQDVTGNFLAATGLSGGTLQHGTNLLYTVNGGGQLTSQSNTITAASSGIAGLSVTALKGNSTVSVTVGIDTAKITSAINSFLAAYNNVQNYIDSQTTSSTDSTGTVTAGVLANDRNVSDLAKSLRENAFNPSSGLAGTVKSLADIGIQSSGLSNSLSLSDSAALNTALTTNIADVTAMFTDATNGVATKLTTYLTNTIGNAGDGGTLVTEESNLTKQSAAITTQISNLETNVQSDIQRWDAEFQAMETAESTSNQQLAYLQKEFP